MSGADAPIAARILLCVPGYPTGIRTWDLLAKLAPESWRVTVVTLPDEPSTSLLDQEAALEAAVLASAGPTTLLGHSLGAYLCARVLPRLGSRVEHAILAGGYAALPAAMAAGHRQLADALDAGAIEAEARRELVHDLMIPPDAPSEEAVSRIDEMLLAPADVVLARQIRRGTLASEPAAAVSPYATRTTVVHGGDDRAVPRALGEELAALGRHASFVPFEGAGHFVQLFHAARLAELAFRAG